MWHMYIRSMTLPPRFSTDMPMSMSVLSGPQRHRRSRHVVRAEAGDVFVLADQTHERALAIGAEFQRRRFHRRARKLAVQLVVVLGPGTPLRSKPLWKARQP